MNKKIIAVDFDGCLFTNEFPNVGHPIEKNIAKLKEEQERGARAVLWTCRCGQKLMDAIEACCAQGIQFDAVNENLPEINEAFGGDCRKIFANEYWDDRAVLVDEVVPLAPSTRQSWAEREVEIACQAERADSGESNDDWDYGCMCYESALKAYKALLGYGHSGFSIQMTKHILVRLLENKPLRPIVDTPDVWSDITEYDPDSGYTCYQCNRMSSLFKYVYPDGRVTYKNVDGYICEDVNNHSTYTTGIVARVFEELFPITLPYMPGDPVRFFCEDILTNEANGDFDTMAIYYAQAPDGTRIDLDRFFKESKDGWEPITKDEWEERLLLAKGLENERKLVAALEEDLAMQESSDDGCQEIGKEEPSTITAEPVVCSYPKNNSNKEVECDVQA